MFPRRVAPYSQLRGVREVGECIGNFTQLIHAAALSATAPKATAPRRLGHLTEQCHVPRRSMPFNLRPMNSARDLPSKRHFRRPSAHYPRRSATVKAECPPRLRLGNLLSTSNEIRRLFLGPSTIPPSHRPMRRSSTRRPPAIRDGSLGSASVMRPTRRIFTACANLHGVDERQDSQSAQNRRAGQDTSSSP